MKRVTAQLSALIFLSYFLGSFAFLNLFLPKLINNDELTIHYAYAYSWWPGQVSAAGFRFVLADAKNLVSFEMPHVRLRVKLRALFDREFETKSVVAGLLKFQLQPRAQRLPEKSGPAEKSNPWRIAIRGIEVAQVTELEFAEFRYRGDLKLQGGFALGPERLEIFSTQLKLKAGELTVAGRPLLRDAEGEIHAAFPVFNPEQTPGMKFFGGLNAQVSVQTQIVGTEFLNYYLQRTPQVRFEGGEGQASLKIAIENGVFSDRSELTIQASGIEVALWEQRARGDGEIKWTTENSAGSVLTVSLRDFSLAARAEPDYHVEGKLCALTVETSDRKINEPVNAVYLGVSIPSAKIEDLRYWNTYIPRSTGLVFLGGSAEVKVSIDADPSATRTDHGELTLQTSHAQIAFGSDKYQGKLTATARFADSSLSQGKLRLPHWRIKAQSRGRETWAMQTILDRAELGFGKEASLKTHIRLEATDARPFLKLASRDGWGSLAAGLLPLKELRGSGYLVADDSQVKLTRVNLDSKNASILGWLVRKDGEGENMQFLLKASPIAIGLQSINGKSSVRLHEAEKWFYAENRSAEGVENENK